MFKGRYLTANQSVVMVHPNTAGDRYCIDGSVAHGHLVKVVAKEGEMTRAVADVGMLWWDEKGDCIRAMGVVDDIRKFNLKGKVNPQSVVGSVKIDGCKECEECS